MQKISVILGSIFFSISAFSSVLSGRYQLEMTNGLSGLSGSVEFLLNSQSEAEIIVESGEYAIQKFSVYPLFGDSDFQVAWGSDEEQHYFSFFLANVNGKPTLTTSCALYVDGPNHQHDFEELSMVLKKWNAVTDIYEAVPVVQDNKSYTACQEELAKNHLPDEEYLSAAPLF